MQVVNIHQAKTNLSKLIEVIMEGHEVIIGKSGKPVAKLVAYKEDKSPREPGCWKGKVWIAEDFDKEIPLVNSLFYGRK